MEQVVVIDADLRARLRNLAVPLELRDETGQVLGHLQPAFRPADAQALLRSCPLSAEELARRGQSVEGRTLPEIWQRLGRTP
ncbi:MAG TPA: hypothetical protein VGF55_07375 [Gemmataceae bacterium]|jgi:hypothetical protein